MPKTEFVLHVGSWEERESASLGEETLENLMGVDSVPLDPTAAETMPYTLPTGIPAPEAMPATSPSMTLSELDKRILELQFFGCAWVMVGLMGIN